MSPIPPTPTAGGGASSATAVTYDNGASGLAATDVQAAIDELAASSGGGGGAAVLQHSGQYLPLTNGAFGTGQTDQVALFITRDIVNTSDQWALFELSIHAPELKILASESIESIMGEGNGRSISCSLLANGASSNSYTVFGHPLVVQDAVGYWPEIELGMAAGVLIEPGGHISYQITDDLQIPTPIDTLTFAASATVGYRLEYTLTTAVPPVDPAPTPQIDSANSPGNKFLNILGSGMLVPAYMEITGTGGLDFVFYNPESQIGGSNVGPMYVDWTDTSITLSHPTAFNDVTVQHIRMYNLLGTLLASADVDVPISS